jgi:hypothetical protein
MLTLPEVAHAAAEATAALMSGSTIAAQEHARSPQPGKPNTTKEGPGLKPQVSTGEVFTFGAELGRLICAELSGQRICG